MRIAFDAKRAYQNTTGLGNYSRLLIEWLAKGYPEHAFYMMAPKQTELFTVHYPNLQTITPSGIGRTFTSLWRSRLVIHDLKRLNIDLYHGLSNEIPVGIRHSNVTSVVTIHDLIFERYPKQYAAVDTAIYRKKFRYASGQADKVIAISKQTKEDLVNYYRIPEEKIAICYQSCDPAFQKQLSAQEIDGAKAKYKLPATYFLYVGSVIERKNLLTICKAMSALKGSLDIPLVVIGTGGSYMQTVKTYVAEQQLTNRVIFLSEKEEAQNSSSFTNAIDFPAIYQGALAFIYPSVYEGFGIPVVEALWSRIPVITSNTSCLPETGGDAALYINPLSVDEMAAAMQKITQDTALCNQMIGKGMVQAQKFTPEAHAGHVMDVYRSIR